MVANPLELWGGVECTFNRVHDRFFDQITMSGHLGRINDLKLLGEVGFKKLRYPVTWERHAPESLEKMDFRWADVRLNKLRELGIEPIAGLLHHGSGPAYTSMMDPEFPQKLAVYSRAVAERYPWVMDFTPVNEPLTTARFSGLYGHWYPHGTDERTFATCLLNECKGTVLAMRAIREVTPHARLVQTEDLAKVFCTPPLAYQAEYENARRWSSFDLLTGKLTPDSLMYQRWIKVGVPAAELDWFLENNCPPDVMGANYYVTSERFLDHRINAYTPENWAHNEREAYVDLASVHVRDQGLMGPGRLLMEAWDRYHLPLAVTEAHMGCTHEEQVRWLAQMWDEANGAKAAGADVRAVTAWCTFGAYHWNTLVTRDDGFYEPGLFDLRSPEPRPTVLAEACKQLAASGHIDHPVLDTPGWWQRSRRFLFPVRHSDENESLPAVLLPAAPSRERKVVVVGMESGLGEAFVRSCEVRGLAHVELSLQEDDFHDATAVVNLLERHDAWAVIYAGQVHDAELAERQPEVCEHRNVEIAVTLGQACAARGARFLTFSSDEVFGGDEQRQLTEDDAISPVNALGRCTAVAESRVQGLGSSMIVRTGPLFGPWDEDNFLARALKQAEATNVIRAVSDEIHSPTYIPDLVEVALDLLIDGETGLWHLANEGAMDLASLTADVMERAGFDRRLVQRLGAQEAARRAPHGKYRALASRRQSIMPPLAGALDRCLIELERGRQSHGRPEERVTQVA